MAFRFGCWVVYFGRDGFYVEKLGCVHFVGLVDLRECRVKD